MLAMAHAKKVSSGGGGPPCTHAADRHNPRPFRSIRKLVIRTLRLPVSCWTWTLSRRTSRANGCCVVHRRQHVPFNPMVHSMPKQMLRCSGIYSCLAAVRLLRAQLVTDIHASIAGKSRCASVSILYINHRVKSQTGVLLPFRWIMFQGPPTCSGPSPAVEQDDRKGDPSPWDELNGAELAAGSCQSEVIKPLPYTAIYATTPALTG